MSEKNSVGLVKAKQAKITTPLKLTSGKKLPSYELAYETYGKLNAKKNNRYRILVLFESYSRATTCVYTILEL
jgi:homoserine acetyltransferase